MTSFCKGFLCCLFLNVIRLIGVADYAYKSKEQKHFFGGSYIGNVLGIWIILAITLPIAFNSWKKSIQYWMLLLFFSGMQDSVFIKQNDLTHNLKLIVKFIIYPLNPLNNSLRSSLINFFTFELNICF